MERKQIYLSRKQIQPLTNLSQRKVENVSELIRQATDQFVAGQEKWGEKKGEYDAKFLQVFDKAFGMWSDRNPKEFEYARRDLDWSVWKN